MSDPHPNLPWLDGATIYLCKHGSVAYGLNTPTSDLDIKGVAIPPLNYFLGFMDVFEQAEDPDTDTVIYELRKFFRLAADCNPNIIEVLWCHEDDILKITDVGQIMRDHRRDFLSKKARWTFSGYAMAQLKRIRTHRKWLLSPPENKPTRAEYGLPETTLITADQLGVLDAFFNDKNLDKKPISVSDDVMEVYAKERSYDNAMRAFGQYQNWKINRNPKRAELEARYGYDCKHAMHLVRLMRMCSEILNLNEVIVRRPDRDELLSIRNGDWSYDRLEGWASDMDEECEALYQSSTLPHHPDLRKLDDLCIDITSGYHALP